MENTKKFKTGQTYNCNSVCDYNCKWSFEVIRRTAKSVWLKETGQSEIKRFAVKVCNLDNAELVWPLGRYSMAPILGA